MRVGCAGDACKLNAECARQLSWVGSVLLQATRGKLSEGMDLRLGLAGDCLEFWGFAFTAVPVPIVPYLWSCTASKNNAFVTRDVEAIKAISQEYLRIASVVFWMLLRRSNGPPCNLTAIGYGQVTGCNGAVTSPFYCRPAPGLLRLAHEHDRHCVDRSR